MHFILVFYLDSYFINLLCFLVMCMINKCLFKFIALLFFYWFNGCTHVIQGLYYYFNSENTLLFSCFTLEIFSILYLCSTRILDLLIFKYLFCSTLPLKKVNFLFNLYPYLSADIEFLSPALSWKTTTTTTKILWAVFEYWNKFGIYLYFYRVFSITSLFVFFNTVPENT